MSSVDERIYDWNKVGEESFVPPEKIQFDDETLRDGLQSPSVEDPPLEKKIELLHLMDRLGIDTADLGLPGAGERPREDILLLAKEIADNGLKIGANVACRTVVSDIVPVVEMSQRAGMPIEVCAFIGSSEIRAYAEDWNLETLLERTRAALEFARDHDIPLMYVTEDTSRAHPETIRALYTLAIELGAKRVCVCDTVGHSTSQGAYQVVRFVKELIDELGVDVGIDWHGHRDRGLALSNCSAAVRAGATRLHGTALGIGERTGNAPMDLMLVNFKLLGWIDQDLTSLHEYVTKCAEAVGVELPYNYPVLGPDAFETGTGVHAAAVVKALRKGDKALADAVYSGVPAAIVGREQSIRVGPMSGKSNVLWVLERLGLAHDDVAVQRVLDAAKGSKHLLTDEQVRAAVEGPAA